MSVPTLEELDRRVAALEATRPGDLRRAAEKIGEQVEDVRLRMTGVETRLGRLEDANKLLIAGQAEMRQKHEERFDRLEADIAGLRRDLPGMLADVVRDVIKP
jgi:hypothetical protein